MEQRIVAQKETKYIYWIKENNIAFYLSIPTNKEVGLIINLLTDVTDEKVINLEDINDKVIITPVIPLEFLNLVRQNNAEAFNKLDIFLSTAINLSHQILTYNKVTVKNSIELNNNKEYSVFNNWFITKYGGRVVLREREENKDPSLTGPLFANTASSFPQPTQTEIPKIEETMELDQREDIPREASLGFVSYVLLGVVVAVASLIFLYLII